MKGWLVSIILFLVIVSGYLYTDLQTTKKEARRVQNNYLVLSDTLRTERLKNGEKAAKIGQLNLTVSEFKKTEQRLTKEVSNLRLKVKNLNSALSVSTQTQIDTIVIIRDSIVNKDTLKTFNWENTWNSLSGVIKKDSVRVSLFSKDTIDIMDITTPKKFLFFRWGVKTIDTYLVNKNKNTEIVKGKHIKIAK